MSKAAKCMALLLLITLSSCTDKKEKYLSGFAELVSTAQFHPAEKTDSDWESIVKDRSNFMREKFVDIHPELTSEDKSKIDSLDNVLRRTVLQYTKSQKAFEAITKE